MPWIGSIHRKRQGKFWKLPSQSNYCWWGFTAIFNVLCMEFHLLCSSETLAASFTTWCTPCSSVWNPGLTSRTLEKWSRSLRVPLVQFLWLTDPVTLFRPYYHCHHRHQQTHYRAWQGASWRIENWLGLPKGQYSSRYLCRWARRVL